MAGETTCEPMDKLESAMPNGGSPHARSCADEAAAATEALEPAVDLPAQREAPLEATQLTNSVTGCASL